MLTNIQGVGDEVTVTSVQERMAKESRGVCACVCVFIIMCGYLYEARKSEGWKKWEEKASRTECGRKYKRSGWLTAT